METEDIPTKEISLWIPIDDKADLAVLGKLAEEVNELGAIIARCIIQGVEEHDPETGKRNVIKLGEEMADVAAMCQHAMERFDMDAKAFVDRSRRKYAYKKTWFEMLRDR